MSGVNNASIALGIPTLREEQPVLGKRKPTRKIMVGSVPVGGDAPISVQSMTTTKTHDIGATLQQIAELTAAGCDIVRVACPTDKDAEALPVIAKQSRIPVIADIHFQPKYVYAAIKAGCGAVRVNPGNIRKFDDQVAEICKMASDYGVSLRIGVNFQGTIKSCAAFGVLLAEGIGDTIRVSLSAPPVEEVKVGTKLLEFMGLRPRKLEIVSCPSCGRAQVDVWTLAEKVEEGLKDVKAPLRVAVMGCVVNGPGEAREADLGCASGNGKGQIFVRGKVVETVPEDRIVETVLRYANDMAADMAAEMGEEALANSAPQVMVPSA